MSQRGALATYVASLREQGYSSDQIKAYLAQNGYSQEQINEAFGVHHHTGALVLLASVLGVLIIALAWFFLFGSASTQPLQLRVTADRVEVFPGQTLVLSLVTDAEATVQMTRVAGPSSAALDATFRGSQGTVTVAENAPPGRYTVFLEATQANRRATGSASFVVVAPQQDESEPASGAKETATQTSETTNNEQIESEEAATHPCPLGCNDYDPCTTDTCVDGTCVYDVIEGVCCGDLVCEGDETSVTCPQDCTAPRDVPETPDIIALASTSYAEDVTHAITLCKSLPKLKDQDLCFSTVARNNAVVSECHKITEENKRDACLMHFVLKHDEFSVCDSFTSAVMENSCYSLQRLKRAEARVTSAS